MPLQSFFNPNTNAQADAQQGHSVAVDGDIAVVGAPYVLSEETAAESSRCITRARAHMVYAHQPQSRGTIQIWLVGSDCGNEPGSQGLGAPSRDRKSVV